MDSIKVVVLDFDNCIALDEKTGTGSEEIKNEAWFEVFPELDRNVLNGTLTIANLKVARGMGDRMDVAKEIILFFGLNVKGSLSDEVNRRCGAFNAFVQYGIKNINLSESVREALTLLSKKYSLYVNTGTPRSQALLSLEALGIRDLFKGVYGRPITKAENLKDIIQKEKVSEKELLFVDDQQGGWEVSLEIGCRFVGIHTARNKEWREKKQPFLLIDSLRELSQIALTHS